MATVKDGRLQLRIDAGEKSLLERAAASTHVSVSAFVLQAAATHAEEVLAERHTIGLHAQAAASFEDALQRPALVNERLADALGRPRKFTWLD
jgi:uncharacterized protein (DUF1778 family)